MEERPPIENTLTIKQNIERVWEAISTADELMRWFPPKARVTPGKSGEIWMSWAEGIEGTEKIEIWEPPKRLRTTWSSPNGPLTVDYHLEADGGQTVLRLVHSGFGRDAKWDEEYDGIRKGWAFELRSLRHYLENHAGSDRSATWQSVPIDVAPDEAWTRMTSEDGLIPGIDLASLKEGDHVELTLSTGERLSGRVFVDPPRNELSLLADSLDGALVRFGVENLFGTEAAYVSISSYTTPGDEVESQASRWKKELQNLLKPATA